MSTKRLPRRQRPQLSCDNCRRYKRKCDRASPCAECRFRGKACSFAKATADTNATSFTCQVSPGSTAASNPHPLPYNSSLNGHTSSSAAPSCLPSDTNIDSVERLEAFACSPNALHHVIAAWRREEDWYHEVILDSPFMTAVMQHQNVDLPLVRLYAGVIYALIALVAQAHPSELEAILIRLCSTSSNIAYTSAEGIGQGAEEAAKSWLARTARDLGVSSWRSEVFQTSFLLTKLNKFLGRWTEYRQSLGLDLGMLQCANYHKLSGLMRDQKNTHQEISTRHRIFWHYFTLERLSSTFDKIPYTLQARNADMWLVEEAGAVHIHRLCGDQLNQGFEHSISLPCYVPSALNLTLSLCGQQMARLAAQAGQLQDQIAALSAASTLSPRHRFERGNKIAACIDEQSIDLQDRFKSEVLPPQHNLLVAVGLARVRRDVSILLCDNLQLDSDNETSWESSARHFRRRRLDLDRALVRCAAEYSGRVMLSLLGEPFFTVFICDSVMELANSVQEQWIEQSRDTTLDDLKFALIGRNLLIVISKQSELQENRRSAAKASQLLASIVSQVFTVSDATILLSKSIRDQTRVVSVDSLSSLAGCFEDQNNVYPEVGNAKEWLDWIASYPALQRICDLPPNDINQMQIFNDVESMAF